MSCRPLVVFTSLLFFITARGSTCVPGEYRFRGSCIKCPRNTYSYLVNQTRCELCPPKTVSPKGSEAFERCKPCPRGRFYNDTIARPICSRCPLNAYTDSEGSAKCTPCPEGTISRETATSLADCIVCPVGLVVERTFFRPFRPSCERCFSGQSTFTINSETCENCPKGMFSNPSVNSCRKCRPGTFADVTGLPHCKDCPVDTFQNEEGASICKKCPNGSTTRGAVGHSSCRPKCVGTPDCKVKSCSPGFELDSSTGKCNKCRAMHVSPARSTTPCFPCRSGGETIANDARTRCICMPGYTKGVNGNCRPCPENTANDDGGRCKCILPSLFEGECRCPPLTTQVGSRCLPCDTRLDPLCEDCDVPNFFNQTSFRCQPCPANTFRGHGDLRCLPCPGDSTSKRGSFSCYCDAGKGLEKGKCETCPPGTFNSRRLSFRNLQCQECSGPKFQDEFGATKCKNTCPRGLEPTRSGATRCLDPCPPNSRRNLPFNDVCRCGRGFENTGTKDEPICTRKPRNNS